MKFMLCVGTDGYILGSYGPYEARKNDATILSEIINKPNNIFTIFRPGDVMVLDRGFRDVVHELRNRNYNVKIPESIGTSRQQLTREQANVSREATKTRFVIEVRNGHIKNIWKYFKQTKIYQAIPYLRKDFEVVVALINTFSSNILSDKNDWEEMVQEMHARSDVRDYLTQAVKNIPRHEFTAVNNLSLFPKLTEHELKLVSQGTYQINQALSYVQQKLKSNNNVFVVHVCSTDRTQHYCARILPKKSNALLLMTHFESRFISMKVHTTHVLLDNYKVKAYCCTCKNGLRSIGCCSHTMALIYFTLHQTHLHFPSANLDRTFDLD